MWVRCVDTSCAFQSWVMHLCVHYTTRPDLYSIPWKRLLCDFCCSCSFCHIPTCHFTEFFYFVAPLPALQLVFVFSYSQIRGSFCDIHTCNSDTHQNNNPVQPHNITHKVWGNFPHLNVRLCHKDGVGSRVVPKPSTAGVSCNSDSGIWVVGHRKGVSSVTPKTALWWVAMAICLLGCAFGILLLICNNVLV